MAFISSPLLVLYYLTSILFIAHAQTNNGVLSQVVFNVDEEQPVGTFVGTVPRNNVKTPFFEFLQNSMKEFRLDQKTGDLTTKQKFDRETLDNDKLTNGFKLLIRLSINDIIHIVVFIDDINDNTPLFPVQKPFIKSVLEDIIAGHAIEFPNAKDTDEGTNADIIYKLEPGNEVEKYFEIQELYYEDGKKYYLVRKEKGTLDVETQADQLNFTISACDRQPKCSHLRMIINILDVNDNTPVINTSLNTHIYIYENATRDKPIFRVHATDADRGSNGEVEYELFSITEFAIQQNTGEIYVVTNELNVEKRNAYILLIVVKDKGKHPLKATFQLEISVLDCNDERPKLKIIPTTIDGSLFNIVEGTAVGTLVATISVTDNDLTQANNQISEVVLTHDLEYFALEKHYKIEKIGGQKKVWKYTVYLTKVINREKTPTIILSVRAKDNGSPPLTGTANYTMYIEDLNDNSPIFLKNYYEGKVNESAPIGKRILKVSATDMDFAQNSDISYSIISKPGREWFTIDEDTGEISLGDNVDRESHAYVLLNVSARDHGIPPLTGHTLVNITVLDTNDNDPSFASNVMHFNVTENNKNGSLIGKMGVSDSDILGSDNIHCSMDSKHFNIHPKSCEIFANDMFDREKVSEYKVIATVTDGYGRQSKGHVIIYVRDVNDNMPRFNTDFFNISIHNDFPVGKNAAYLTAIDLDVGVNALARYTAEFTDDVFSIDDKTGGVTLQKDLSKVTKTQFIFTVFVEDRSGDLKGKAKANVQLNVLPPSTRPPVFEKDTYRFSVKENNHPNFELGRVTAKRPLSNSETFIKYTIKSGNKDNIFNVGQFGALNAVKKIDYENHTHFNLVIEADDVLHSSLASNVSVLIAVIDVNDNEPTFIVSNNFIKVKEGVAIGHVLFTCKTVDLDSGRRGHVTYSIKNTTGHFTIHPTSGQVRTNGSLDFESSEHHVIFIQASDDGEPSLSTILKLNIQIKDMNDNAPLFYNNSYVIHVKESVAVNTSILTVNASDADSGRNGEFFFTLEPSEDAKTFIMRGGNGELSVVKGLDREKKSSYSLVTTVEDFGIPPQNSKARITIIVDDVNDETPEFEKPFYLFEVREELPAGTVVGEVVASDADTGENGKFTYFLRENHKDKFEIMMKKSTYGKQVCIITTKKRFDRETEPESYNITVGVSDFGLIGNSNEVTVQIVIKNINDHPPVFGQKIPYVSCVVQGTNIGTPIITITAEDLDKIPVPLVYSLISFNETEQSSLNFFEINKSNGTITTRRKLVNVKEQMFKMVVRVEENTIDRPYVNYQKVVIFVVPKLKGVLFRDQCIISKTLNEQTKPGYIAYDNFNYDPLYMIGNYRIEKQPGIVLPFSILRTTGIVSLDKKLSHTIRPFYQLNITAEGKKNSLVFKDFTIVNVYVIPKNMYPPWYPKNPEKYFVPEDIQPGKPFDILKLPFDRDKGMEGKCIFSIEEPVDIPIEIRPMDRQIVFTRPIDREKDSNFILKIRVSDLAEDILQRLSNTFTVAITVVDINDNAPKFISSNYSDVYEDAKKGSIVANVMAEDPDDGMTNTAIKYEISSGNWNNTFTLDRYTGALSTAKPLNIEKRQKFTLKLMASELRDLNNQIKIPSLKSFFDLTVKIIDVNNKAPKFSQAKYNTHVKEGAPVGTSVLQLISIDDDLKPAYKEVVYKFLEDNSGFSVDPKTGVISTKIVHDREKHSKFTLDVVVSNVAAPYSEDTCVVVIVIDDVNDNPPEFSGGYHSEICIMENSKPTPRVIHRFSVIDKDDFINAKVTYSITQFQSKSNVLRLDSNTGELWVQSVLDRENRSKYLFTVEATNVSPPNHKCHQNVTVIVDDENDEDPVFKEKLYKISVNEGQELNTSIVNVMANDEDIGSNAIIIYSIMNTTLDGIGQFDVNQKTGNIHLVTPLDYEKKKHYTFDVKATGTGINSFDTTTVDVTVVDKNDNKPQFSKSIYEFDAKVAQTLKAIGTVQATDADKDGKQKVRYSIVPQSKEFTIDANTGEIRIKDPNLIHGQYRLHVEAQDYGILSSLKNLAEVLVTVGDENKSFLKFLNSSVVFSLDENPVAHYNLGKLIATSKIKAEIRYHLVPASNPEYAFGIDSKSGQLFVNNSAAVDYEKYANFFLGVLAYTKKPSHSTFLHVLINLTDLNDNTPYIYPSNISFHTEETNYYPLQATHLYQFLVKDDDKIDDNRLKLEILSGNEDGLFHIDQWRRLSTVKNLDYEVKSMHHLIIRVTDGGNPVRHKDSHLYLSVDDVNDNPPVFTKMGPISVSEATPTGKVIATVKATDRDTIKSDIVYRIEDSNTNSNLSIFSIVEDTGTIYLLKHLDYEKKNLYELKLSAFDGIHRTYKTVKIKVIDVNDHEPRFTKSIYKVKDVSSLLKKNEYIIKVHANDQDRNGFAIVQYKLDPPMDAFTIEQDSGYIFANKAYRFAPGNDLYKLRVVAFDSYGKAGSLKSAAIVELHITRVKRPFPEFTKRIYNFSVTENSPPGVVIDKVQAVFLAGIQREMSYRIVGGNTNQAFTIGVRNGVVKIKNKIDREVNSHYTLEVVGEADNLLARCLIGVEIVDINDNQPDFEKAVYSKVVKEDIAIGTKLIQVKATDADDPKSRYGNITYSIHSGQEGYNWLEINKTDGWVRTRNELDREKVARIQLTIRAVDVRGNGLQAFASLNITVLDVNDNGPEFEIDLLTVHEIKVKENADPHTLVFKANAVDKDEGENGRVSYRILKGTGVDKFYMNSSTPGWVYTKERLDYEKVHQYNLSVLAYDHGKPKKEYSVEYQIYVDDVNEYQPVFYSNKVSFNIYADLAVGSELGNVTASDQDGGEAGIVRYTIEPNPADAFEIDAGTGTISVKRDLRRRTTTTSENRKRRDTDSVSGEDLSFIIHADNGPNTQFVTSSVSVYVNYTCPNCVVATKVVPTTIPMKGSTTVVVLASIAVFLMILFVLCMAYFLRKKGCFNRSKHPTPRFCTAKKDGGLSSSVERELMNSGTSSFDRLQQHFNDHQAEKSRVSEDTGLLIDGSATARSVSATDKASTFSFGIYHEQGIPESEMHTLGSEMTLKDFEHDSVFGYSPNKLSEPAKSCISRSTQESSLYSFSSAAHRNAFNFTPRLSNNKMITATGRSNSHESLKDFMEEGGGEAAGGIDVGNLLYAKLAEVDADEQDAIMDGVRPFQEEGPLSHGGSFSTIIGSDEDLRRHYNYNNYLNTWRPQFHPVNSVFSEIGRTAGGPRSGATHGVPNGHHCPPRGPTHGAPPPMNYTYDPKDIIANNSVTKQSIIDSNSSRPSKSVKPPDDIPLKVMNSGRTSMLSSVQSLPHTPQDMQSNYTSGAMSPNFTPAITPLVFRSPSVSSIGTQDNFSTNSKTRNGFEIGFTNLRRADSNVSQLSRITLSDLDMSDAEMEV